MKRAFLLLFLVPIILLMSASPSTAQGSVDKAPFPFPIGDPAFAVCMGNLYIIGGFGNSSAEIRNTTFRYNASADSWVRLRNMTSPRWGATASCSGDRVYVFAGNDGAVSNVADYYNITADTWTTVTPEPSLNMRGQGDCSATYNTDSIFVQRFNLHKRYTVSTDTWAGFASTDDFGLFMNCGIVGDFFYVMGGNTLTTRVNRWDILGGSWTSSYDTVPYVQYGGLESVVRNGLIYYGYGFDNTNFFAKMYSYDPASKIWTRLVDGNHPRDGVGTGILNNTILIVGGRFHVPAFGLDYVEAYDITPNPPASTPTSLDFIAFLLILWVALLLLGYFKYGPILFFSFFVGLELAVQVFGRFGDLIVPLILVAANLVVLAFAVGDLIEDRRLGTRV